MEKQNQYPYNSRFKKLFQKFAKLIKFALSSGLSFLIDFSLYALFLKVTNGLAHSLIVSNISARIISSSVNYIVNRNLVFSHKGNIAKSALEYFALAIFILFANTILLSILVNHFGVKKLVAKLLVEVTLFIISWTIQRFVIFRNRNNTDD